MYINKKIYSLVFIFSVSANFAHEKNKVLTYPAQRSESGWEIIDPLPRNCKEENRNGKEGYNCNSKNLPKFELRSLKEVPRINESVDAPWRAWKNIDFKVENEAKEFALRMQMYAYKGFINKSNNRDFDFIVQNNEERYWCHTPWLNIGKKGRELIHGLTKEFPIAHSPNYPGLKRNKSGVSWGSAYFNKYACQDYTEIYGTQGNEVSPGKLSKLKAFSFKDGYVSTKLLFNNGPTEMFDGAYEWQANASKSMSMFSNSRKLTRMRHLQMDIAIKDSALAKFGAQKSVNNWIMLTYAYDKEYDIEEELKGRDDELAKFMRSLPKGLTKMRPIGIQYGLSQGESTIFTGAKNNHAAEVEIEGTKKTKFDYIYDNSSTRLNGPADNPSSSCLGCHALAGLEESVIEENKLNYAIGILDTPVYENLIKEKVQHFDFNQQLKLSIDYIKAMQASE